VVEPAAPDQERLIELFTMSLGEALLRLGRVVDRDWSSRAGTLDWTCGQTVDHVTDCLFSYALQVAGQVRGGWLHLEELHARPETAPAQLLESLRAVGAMFAAVLRAAPGDALASDSVVELGLEGWVARALNELLLHSSDVVRGLDGFFEAERTVCAFVLATPTLWMYDGADRTATDPWREMLRASGRPVT
jgi:hypothetical protein